MSSATSVPVKQGQKKRSKKTLIGWAVVLVAIVLLALGTKVVSQDDPLLAGEIVFQADEFGAENFPAVQEAIAERAVDASELASAIQDDADAAKDEYAQVTSSGTVFSVNITGVAGEGKSGIYEVDVPDVPDSLLVRVQTGPAINGTELRDATGTMSFGDFSNQIQFQDAAAALNDEMKLEVLEPLDLSDLEGQSISVTGAFTLVNEDAWLITPVTMEVQ